MICTVCNGDIPAGKRPWAKTCSKRCSRERATAIHRQKNPPTGLPSATVGAIAELAVAADLLSRGYEVFRAMSPSCSCDLAINSGGILIRVEVRTGYITSTGRLGYPKPATDKGRQDIYAVRTKDGVITYIPDLDVATCTAPPARGEP